MTLVCMVLVDKKGRRFLLLVGLGGMIVLYAVTTVAFKYVEDKKDWAPILGVVCTLGAVVFFQAGPGAIPWFIVAELFSQNSLSAAVSVAGPMNWLGNFVVGLLFPVIKDKVHPYTFIPFIVLLVIFFAFTYLVVPETKGLSIAQINRILRKDGGAAGYPDEADKK
uniref:Major facilitator superfamily (MFS) profile domain-containing protein n=2 Tax=Clytia hemisphaerica TaxID=252671 RepID=A0A7M5U2D0_9CNID